MCRLDVDWEGARARLAAIATRAHVPLNGGRGVLALVEAARGQGAVAALREMEAALGVAEVAGAGRCEINEGLLEWLAQDAAAAELSVLSLNSPAAVELALARTGLRTRIRWILGRGDTRPKPDPQGVELLLARHCVCPADTLFVGDSETDRACAVAAGVDFLHVSELGARWRRPAVAAA